MIDLQALVEWGGYLSLALIVFAETGSMIGSFLPGGSLLVAAGLVASGGQLDLAPLLALLTSMAILGDATGYLVGRRLGPSLFRRERSLSFRRDHLVRTQRFYERHGGKTIVLARFIPGIRTFAPVVAGIAGMDRRRFTFFNVVGGVGWVVSMTMTGFLLGKVVPAIARYAGPIVLVLVVVSTLPPVIMAWKERQKNRREQILFRESVRQLVEVIRAAQWDWSPAGAQRIARTIAASDGATAILRHGDLDRRIGLRIEAADETRASVEIITAEAFEPAGASEVARESTALDLAGCFRTALEAMTDLLDQPAFVGAPDGGPLLDDERAIRAAVWPFHHGELVLMQRRHHERHDVALVLKPPESVSPDRISA